IIGDRTIEEKEIDLKGYLDNIPVRIGNDAYTHIQNDVYGQVLVGLQPLYTDERLVTRTRSKSLPLIHFLLDKISETMNQPDAGLWEFRNKQQKHCYTFLFHWAGSKAAAKIGKELNDISLESKAIKIQAEAGAQIEKCFDADRGVYTHAIGSSNLDASSLQLITMNYLDPATEKARKHLEVLEKELMTDKKLFYRYKHEDDFGFPESTFLVCAFWYAEALACVGRVQEASEALDRLVKFSNHLGIFSEDVGNDGSQWGNFPQTYSHVGLMNTAFRIARKLDVPMFF
ncbi:MAG TPA: glycoside hydrolase family 15 protein, partial [Cyclobacteriaceae bacterium]|nr:glycoside hydrolase family 15 protein [Cyclobacteriaceae bacterium]